MEEQINFETWLQDILKRPIPKNPMERLRTLAKELAEGASEHVWGVLVDVDVNPQGFYIPRSKEIQSYLNARWETINLDSGLLHSNNYLDGHRLTENAFGLIGENEYATIFISYKRSESSAFAMYVLTRLKQESLEAFVDMALIPGEDWHAGLKERIKQYDYLVLLLGKETLKSDVCIKEIRWAIEAGLTVIPVWHNGFKYKASEWNLPENIDHLINDTHAIQVKEESASGYNTAMVEILNRFGITP